MNDKMLDIIGLADEKYLLEAELSARGIRYRKKLAVGMAAAAAAAVMTVSVGAAPLLNKESVKYYYNETMASQLEEYGLISGQVTENEHVRMTLEYLTVDENYASGIITVEYLDEAGRKAFEPLPCTIMFDSRGDRIPTDLYSQSVLSKGIVGNNFDGKEAYMLEIFLKDPFSESSNRVPDTLNIQFSESKNFPNGYEQIWKNSDLPEDALSGLCLEIDTKPNVKSIHLAAESGHKAVISQADYDIQAYGNDKDTDHQGVHPVTMILNYTGGVRKTLNYNEYRYKSDFVPDSCWWVKDNSYDTNGQFTRLLDLEGLESVEFAGETYRVIR